MTTAAQFLRRDPADVKPWAETRGTMVVGDARGNEPNYSRPLPSSAASFLVLDAETNRATDGEFLSMRQIGSTSAGSDSTLTKMRAGAALK
jgi:hypothetical protein